MSRRRWAVLLLLVLALCVAFSCGRKAKPEPLRGAESNRPIVSSSR